MSASSPPPADDQAAPTVWWSPTHNALVGKHKYGECYDVIEQDDMGWRDTDELSALPADAVRLVPAPAAAVPAETRDARRARNLEAAGIQLADAARTLAYTWETDSTDKRMWDAWKKVGPAIDAWMAALRADDSEGTS